MSHQQKKAPNTIPNETALVHLTTWHLITNKKHQDIIPVQPNIHWYRISDFITRIKLNDTLNQDSWVQSIKYKTIDWTEWDTDLSVPDHLHINRRTGPCSEQVYGDRHITSITGPLLLLIFFTTNWLIEIENLKLNILIDFNTIKKIIQTASFYSHTNTIYHWHLPFPQRHLLETWWEW